MNIKRTTISIKEKLHKQVRIKCLEEGITMSSLIERLLEDEIGNNESSELNEYMKIDECDISL